MRSAALLVVACAGCGAPGAPGAPPPPPARQGAEAAAVYRSVAAGAPAAEEPPILDPVAAPLVLAPREPRADFYGGPAEAGAPGRLAQAVIALARRRSSRVTLDGRLSRACAQLAEIAPPAGALGDGVVEYARQRNGIAEPEPSLVVVRADPADPAAVAARLGERLTDEMFHGPAVRIGLGVAPGQGARAIALLIARTSVALEPVPRAAPVGATLAVEAIVHERMRAPVLEVSRPDLERGGRAVTRPELSHGPGGRVSGRFACGEPGRLDVELAATGARGRVVLARFPVWCGAEPPARYIVAPPGAGDGIAGPAQAERRLVALVNRDRIEAGAAPLRSDPRLVAAARRRAAVLRDTRGNAPPLHDRDLEPGASASGAAGRGVAELYEALANEPRDRERMLSPELTHLGLGAAASAEFLFASLMYLAIPPPIDLEQGRRAIAARMTDGTDIAVDAELAEIAQRFAERTSAGRAFEPIWRELKPLIDHAGRHYKRIEYSVSRSRALEPARIQRLLAIHDIDDLGVGVAQADHAEHGRRTIWVVVFWGKRLVPRTLDLYLDRQGNRRH